MMFLYHTPQGKVKNRPGQRKNIAIPFETCNFQRLHPCVAKAGGLQGQGA